MSAGGERPGPLARAYFRALVAREGGSIPCERFMEEALYHPEFGYYARQIPTIGRGGDFATSATLHGALGRAVAAWALARAAELRWARPWHVIELGAGGGQLAREFRRGLGWWRRGAVRYHIVERSGPLRREQHARLSGHAAVAWHEDIRGALEAAEGRALIFSNEFVDAFPCVVLERSDGAGGGWREVRLRWDAGEDRLVECAPEASQSHYAPVDATGSVFAPAYCAAAPTGQRVEWHRAYRRWLATWEAAWTQGSLLTIDYGDRLPALYARRPSGTLRAYARQQRITGPDVYARPGRQDLTADVNFTDLENWGTELGLRPGVFCTQAEFLRARLAPGFLRRHEASPALRFLLDPAGAGGAFRVLEQHRVPATGT